MVLMHYTAEEYGNWNKHVSVFLLDNSLLLQVEVFLKI